MRVPFRSAMQSMLEPLRAVNSSALADVTKTREDRVREGGGSADELALYEAVHPVVRTHPETGRKALYVNSAHTARFEGMTEERSEEHTSELQSLMRISYAVFCLKKKNTT